MAQVWGRAVAAAVLVGALAACAGEPEPLLPDSSSAPGTPSESPSSAASEPTALPAVDRSTRRSVIEAWVAARNSALNDGDVRAMRQLDNGDCLGCRYFIRDVEEVYDAGGYFDTPGWVIRESIMVGATVTDIRVRTSAGEIRETSDAAVRTFGPTTRDLRFYFSEEKPWSIANIGVLQD